MVFLLKNLQVFLFLMLTKLGKKSQNNWEQIVIYFNLSNNILAATAVLADNGGSGVSALSSMMYGSLAINIVMYALKFELI